MAVFGQSSDMTIINNDSVLLYSQLDLTGSKTLLVYAFWVTMCWSATLASSLSIDQFDRVRLLNTGIISPLFKQFSLSFSEVSLTR